MINEDLFIRDFAPQFADGAASLCLRLGQPNESEGSLSALFPAPLHMGFPAVMSAIFRSLFLGKSLPIPLKDNSLIEKAAARVRLTNVTDDTDTDVCRYYIYIDFLFFFFYMHLQCLTRP